MDLCSRNNIDSVAFPVLGTGIGGLDIRECARIEVGKIMKFCEPEDAPEKPNAAVIVLRSMDTFNAFNHEVRRRL